MVHGDGGGCPALMDRVEPYCVIATSCSQTATSSSVSPGPSEPNTRQVRCGSSIGLQRYGAFEIVHSDDDVAIGREPVGEVSDRRMVLDVQIAVGDHCSPPIPPPTTDDVYAGDVEGVGGPDDGANVEIVLPVLDGDVQRLPSWRQDRQRWLTPSSSDIGRSHCDDRRARAAPGPAWGRRATASDAVPRQVLQMPRSSAPR